METIKLEKNSVLMIAHRGLCGFERDGGGGYDHPKWDWSLGEAVQWAQGWQRPTGRGPRWGKAELGLRPGQVHKVPGVVWP